MDVLPDDQEILIQETARAFLAAEATPALVRAAEKDPARHSAQLWKKLAELGWQVRDADDGATLVPIS